MQTAVVGTPFTVQITGAQTGLALQAWICVPVTWAFVAARTTATEVSPGTYTASFSGVYGPSEPGEYLVVWDTGSEPASYVTTLEMVAFPGSVLPVVGDLLPAAPTVADVAGLMQGRLHDDDGNENTTFTTSTVPTAAQVTAIIQSVVLEVAARVQVRIPAVYASFATSVVAIGVVAYIEQTYFPETTGVGDSTYTSARSIFLGRLADLAQVCQGAYTVRLA